MNYYKRYAIDHAARTAHFSILEEGAYTRLLDWQYSNESPLPPTPTERYRITRAITLAERRVTDKIAATCFGADGWQQRARQEIERSRPAIEAHRLDLASVLRSSPANEREVPQGVADLIRIPCAQAPTPAAEAAPPAPIAVADAAPVLTFGLTLLTAQQVDPGMAESFLALMRQALGDDSTFDLLRACERQKVRDPLPWLRRHMEVRRAR
ncbi:DUF1376 domain-containing protein [Solimonas sp. K1W22B-7]|uniref:DUF1376 domain-containing protein n=1 Tax=Solimonas sp. K1W22B-7 TaxID=2303331 RepID=UPI000E331EA5|nr:DUF1376 domain-containing protein [Solimonas sp. K1W22B-7]AXQ27868.1 DUF1376 domain-containing protein [Solimonas sp. K1W22B-7]